MKSILELNRKEVIHVPTQEDANKLLKIFDELGLSWCSGASYLEVNEWHKYKEKTCYGPAGGDFSPVDFYTSNGYRIYKLEELKEWQPLKSIDDLVREGRSVIFAPDLATAELICKAFHEKGWVWGVSGESFLNQTHFRNDTNDTCYNPTNKMQADYKYYEDLGYNIYTIDQLKEFQTAKNNFMKTTKQKLLTIYGKDSCGEFNNILEEILKSQFKISDTTEFTISQGYLNSARNRCSKTQKELLKSIGIDFNYSNWSRTHSVGNNEYFFLERGKSGEPFKVEKGSNSAKPAITCYKTREIAEREAKLFSLMMIMRNWAIYHNQIDNFVPDWQSGSQQKFGLMLHSGNKLSVISRYGDNEFLFFITLKTKDRAEAMLKEFETEIKEIASFL